MREGIQQLPVTKYTNEICDYIAVWSVQRHVRLPCPLSLITSLRDFIDMRRSKSVPTAFHCHYYIYIH